ncbi:SRPBCC family protein [Flavobacterium sp. JAS]|uniref:SRPBCC family protein n=1 Tax=Flavobacterium sp. JAS TaxID=2897329 RepID=UPI001E36B652|nr:SRPBCC family protein [Flavobacterium sp. JAS]MCD0469812.1 SRPBCC family protein [Flavobacterium sp. JAS]
MKMIIVKIITVLVAIISLALVVAMFTKDKYTITRQIVINKSKHDVFDFIKLNQNQKLYSKWLLLDPNTKIEIKGAADGTSGSVLAFESKHHKTGKGEWEIKKVTDGEKVDFELRFLAPYVFTANGYMATESLSANQTKLNWVYNSGMNWPKNFMLIFLDMDKLIGSDVEESLHNIKTIVEK